MSSVSTPAASTAGSSRVTFITGLVLLGFLGLIPLLSVAFEDPFLLTLFTRIVIMAIAAVSLNLILGYGGMVSFGHAAYIGVGGYTVGILAFHGVHAAWIQWPLAIIISGVVAALIGLLSLRTKGIFFIMITLAFSQLVYYLGNGAFAYGGDDGLNIMKRSDFGGLLNLDHRPTFYYLCWVILLATIFFVHRTVNSRFGMVLQGAKSNDRRMATIGFPVHRYRLTAFIIAGMICGLAGVLTATFSNFISPAMMHWTRSGDLIVMVVLGGMGSLFGPVFGTVAFLLLEEILSSWTEYWKIVFGPILVLVVLFARGGIDGALMRGQAGAVMAGCFGFFMLYGIHSAYESEWLVPTLILAGTLALAWFAKWDLQRRGGGHD